MFKIVAEPSLYISEEIIITIQNHSIFEMKELISIRVNFSQELMEDLLPISKLNFQFLYQLLFSLYNSMAKQKSTISQSLTTFQNNCLILQTRKPRLYEVYFSKQNQNLHCRFPTSELVFLNPWYRRAHLNQVLFFFFSRITS